MLQTPETAAELKQLRARVAELDAQREALTERLRAGQHWQRGRNPELVSENYVSQSELRDIFGIALAAPWDATGQDPCHPCGCPKRFDRHAWGCPEVAAEGRTADEDPIAFVLTDKAAVLPSPSPREDVSPRVRKLRNLIAGQRAEAGERP